MTIQHAIAANRRLIAAAPELLKAAKFAAQSYHHPACPTGRPGQGGNPERNCSCHVQVARAAIAKAEGGAP